MTFTLQVPFYPQSRYHYMKMSTSDWILSIKGTVLTYQILRAWLYIFKGIYMKVCINNTQYKMKKSYDSTSIPYDSTQCCILQGSVVYLCDSNVVPSQVHQQFVRCISRSNLKAKKVIFFAVQQRSHPKEASMHLLQPLPTWSRWRFHLHMTSKYLFIL